MYCRTDMAANLLEHDIFAKTNAPICKLTNKSAATLGDRNSIILDKKQCLFLLFKWRMFSFRKYKFHSLISKLKIKWYRIKLSCICLGVVVFAAISSMKSFKPSRENIHSTYQRKYKDVGILFWSKTFYFKAKLRPAVTVLVNLIDRVTQHGFVDTNFGQIWSMFYCQTKRTIAALFRYPEIPPCRVLFWARWSNIYLFTRLCNPAQSPIFTAQFASQNLHNFLFFSRTLSEGLLKHLVYLFSLSFLLIDWAFPHILAYLF